MHTRSSKKVKAQIGGMDVILRCLHLDVRMKICIVMNVIVSKLESAGGLWERNVKMVKKRETVHMTAAEMMLLGCSKRRARQH